MTPHLQVRCGAFRPATASRCGGFTAKRTRSRVRLTRLRLAALRVALAQRTAASDAPDCTKTTPTIATPTVSAVADATRHRRASSQPSPGDLFQGQRHGFSGEGVTAARAESNPAASRLPKGQTPVSPGLSGMGRVRPTNPKASRSLGG